MSAGPMKLVGGAALLNGGKAVLNATCCCSCHKQLGDKLDVVLSGWLGGGCFLETSFGTDARLELPGVDGRYTAFYDADNDLWRLSPGSNILTTPYDEPGDGTCGEVFSEATPTTGTNNMEIRCSPERVFDIVAISNNLRTYAAWKSTTGTVGDAIANEFSAADLGQLSGFGDAQVGGYGGTITISRWTP